MMRWVLALLTGAGLALACAPASAQTMMSPCVTIPGGAGNFSSCAPVTTGNPLPTSGTPPTTIVSGQATCSPTPTLAVAARTGRLTLTVTNEGTTPVRLGPSGVTILTGVLLPGAIGSAMMLNGGAALYCVTATGTQTISFIEAF